MARKAWRRRRARRLVRLWDEQKGECYICGVQMMLRTGQPRTATLDHVFPKSLSFPDDLPTEGLIRAACAVCNEAKTDTVPDHLKKGIVYDDLCVS